jgi:DNA-binding XRE family transcriptional regulator
MLPNASVEPQGFRAPSHSSVSNACRTFSGFPERSRSDFTSARDWNPLELLQALLGQQGSGSEPGFEEIDLSPALFSILLESHHPIVSAQAWSQSLAFSECAKALALRFSISKSDLAKLFGVSRPTFYAWMKGESEPRDEIHRRKLLLLGSLANELFQPGSRPLYHRFVYEPMLGETRSLYQALKAQSWDELALRQLIARAIQLSAQRDRHMGAQEDVPRDIQEQNLQDNLLSLGGV